MTDNISRRDALKAFLVGGAGVLGALAAPKIDKIVKQFRKEVESATAEDSLKVPY